VPLPQALAVASKAGLLAAIDELDKMTASLKEALKEELVAAASDARKEALAEAETGASAGTGLGLQLGAGAAPAPDTLSQHLTAARCPLPRCCSCALCWG
jgi:hypothetical protein